MKKEYYLIGSLRNPHVAELGNLLRKQNVSVFDSWFGAGPHADDCWRDYEKAKGTTYKEALADYAAQHVFQFDRRHLDRCYGAILVCPAGRSGHLELGYVLGQGKPGYIYLPEEPERWDVMYNFATAVCYSFEELLEQVAEKTIEKVYVGHMRIGPTDRRVKNTQDIHNGPFKRTYVCYGRRQHDKDLTGWHNQPHCLQPRK